MDIQTILISIIAIIPAILLCIYVYKKDRAEKEPVGLLALLFVLGSAFSIPTIVTQNFWMSLVDELFVNQQIINSDGIIGYTSNLAYYTHHILYAFIATAFTQEMVMWLIMVIVTYKSKNFNSLFDGIIYAVFVALGFSTVENIYFSVINGWDTLLMKTCVSLPGHLLFSVIMGYFYTLWHINKQASLIENDYEVKGLIKVDKAFSYRRWLILSIIAPIGLHGIYSLSEITMQNGIDIAFYALVGIGYIFCFHEIKKQSEKDELDKTLVANMIKVKYPNISNSNSEE